MRQRNHECLVLHRNHDVYGQHRSPFTGAYEDWGKGSIWYNVVVEVLNFLHKSNLFITTKLTRHAKIIVNILFTNWTIIYFHKIVVGLRTPCFTLPSLSRQVVVLKNICVQNNTASNIMSNLLAIICLNISWLRSIIL